MRVMVFHKTSGDVDMTTPPTPEQLEAFAAMDRLTEELVAAGVFVAAAGLKGGADARRILFRGGRKTVLDGPFAETKEVIAGFSIWEVKDMDEALAWVARMPAIDGHDGAIEIQPYYEAEDLAAFMTGEELAAPRDGAGGSWASPEGLRGPRRGRDVVEPHGATLPRPAFSPSCGPTASRRPRACSRTTRTSPSSPATASTSCLC